MTAAQFILVMSTMQVVLGLSIMAGGLILLSVGTDGNTRRRTSYPLIGLVCWGAWLTFPGLAGTPDSPPALALALAVAYVICRRGRQVRGILDGETWWAPNARAAALATTVFLSAVPAAQAWWRAPRAFIFSLLIGVAGHDRVVTGPCVPHTLKPGGGCLWCVSVLVLRDRAISLPFVSCSCRFLRACAGWRPDGMLTLGLRISPRGRLEVL